MTHHYETYWKCRNCGFMLTAKEYILIGINQRCPKCEKIRIANFSKRQKKLNRRSNG